MAGSTLAGDRPSGSIRRGLVIASVSLLAGIALHAALGGHPPSTKANANQPRGGVSEGATQQTDSSTQATSIGTAGPSRVQHGVPAGFGQTSEGAVAAAASFVCTGQAILNMDPLAAEQAIREMASSTSADQQVADALTKLRAARAALAGGSGPVIYRQAAIAWRVENFSTDRARVAVWNVGVLVREGVAPPQAGWAISTFDLVWERDDWRVLDETVAPGPAPILDNSAAPSTAIQFTAMLQSFTDFGSHP